MNAAHVERITTSSSDRSRAPGKPKPSSAGIDALIEEQLIVRSFADVEAKPIEWMWEQRIPKNKLSLFIGNPDVGKTTAICDVIARYTTGADYPDGSKNRELPGEVLMLSGEDDPSDTLKPRLMAAGADVSKVHYVKAVEISKGAKKHERMLALDQDLDLLEKKLKDNPLIGLIDLDPITNYFGKADLNKDQELRRVLGTVRDLAERVRVTIIGLGHFNKRSDVSALHRVGGAVALTAVPRAVWLFVKDQDEAGLYKMLLGKGNLTRNRKGLKYRIAEKILATGGAPFIQWEGETAEEAEDAMVVNRDHDARALSKAKRFLTDHFKNHPELQPSAPIIAEAEEKYSISESTLHRARKSLNINVTKPAGVWSWEPAAEAES